MAGSRLVRTALRCYPERWWNRHGEEAAELARLLIRDGTPARSIAWSYLKGAASARLVPRPRRRVGVAVGALLAVAGSLGVSLALLSSSAPANAVTGRALAPPGPLAPAATGSPRTAITTWKAPPGPPPPNPSASPPGSPRTAAP